ncbi:hypothetical protein JCM16138_14130 [Thermococcus atlanticus]
MRKTIGSAIILLLILFVQSVFAQPEWDWTYKDQCIVFSMAFNHKGDLAVGFGYDAILLKPSGTRVFKVPTRDFAYSIAVSDNDYTVVGTRGFFVQLFDPSGKLVYEYKTGNQVWAVDISRDGRMFVAGSQDGWIYYFRDRKLLWKKDTGAPIWGVQLYNGTIVTGNNGGMITVFDASGRILWSKNLGGRVWRIKAADDRIAALTVRGESSITSTLYMFTLNGTELWHKEFSDYVRDMDFDGKRVVVGGDIGEIDAFDVNGSEIYSVPNFEVVWDISLGGGYTLAGGGKDAFFIAPGGDVEWIYETNETIEHVAMSEDGRYLAVSHKVFSKVVCEGTIDFLDREKGQKGKTQHPY